MDEQSPAPTEPLEQMPPEPPQVRCGFWVLWRLALAAAAALSYSLCYFLPRSEYTLPPVTLLIFGFLAGGVQGSVLRKQVPPIRRWIQASTLAGLVAALISILPTGLAASSVGLYAGWAYAWAAYGAVLGVMAQRFFPGRRWMLASLIGWALASVATGPVTMRSPPIELRYTSPSDKRLESAPPTLAFHVHFQRNSRFGNDGLPYWYHSIPQQGGSCEVSGILNLGQNAWTPLDI